MVYGWIVARIFSFAVQEWVGGELLCVGWVFPSVPIVLLIVVMYDIVPGTWSANKKRRVF